MFEFFCSLLNVPVVPVSTSIEFISYRFIRNIRAATIFAPDLTSKIILQQGLHNHGDR